MVFSLITAYDMIKATATSILDTMRKDNHRGGGALRTPAALFTRRKTKFCPAVVSDGNQSIITEKKWMLGAVPAAACSK